METLFNVMVESWLYGKYFTLEPHLLPYSDCSLSKGNMNATPPPFPPATKTAEHRVPGNSQALYSRVKDSTQGKAASTVVQSHGLTPSNETSCTTLAINTLPKITAKLDSNLSCLNKVGSLSYNAHADSEL